MLALCRRGFLAILRLSRSRLRHVPRRLSFPRGSRAPSVPLSSRMPCPGIRRICPNLMCHITCALRPRRCGHVGRREEGLLLRKVRQRLPHAAGPLRLRCRLRGRPSDATARSDATWRLFCLPGDPVWVYAEVHGPVLGVNSGSPAGFCPGSDLPGGRYGGLGRSVLPAP